MHVVLLGTSAGGGLPQWNCGCAQCAAVRNLSPNVSPRSQSSIAVSADGERWLLLNCSPDVRTQLASVEALHPRSLRHSPVAAVGLTNADIDHSAGLLVLREGGAPPIYCTPRVERALRNGLRVLPTLEAYGSVVVRPWSVGSRVEVRDKAGVDLGLRVEAFAVASKPPPYMLPLLDAREASDLYAGDTVGLRVSTAGGDRALVYVPGVKNLDDTLRAMLSTSALALIDGTCFTDDELVSLGASTRTAKAMGHCPLSGDDGLLAFLDGVSGPRKVLVHLNNTNPALREGSEARSEVERHGVEVGRDAQRFTL